MSVAFDATFLLPLAFPDVPAPPDPSTNKPITALRERLDGLIAELEERRDKIIIPTPALSEMLVRSAAAGQAYLERIRQSRAFKIEPFDERAALEVALVLRQNIEQMGKKRGKRMAATWAKVKFDQQIVAIAKVSDCAVLYSDDEDVRAFAQQLHLKVVRLHELAIPTEESQLKMFDA